MKKFVKIILLKLWFVFVNSSVLDSSSSNSFSVNPRSTFTHNDRRNLIAELPSFTVVESIASSSTQRNDLPAFNPKPLNSHSASLHPKIASFVQLTSLPDDSIKSSGRRESSSAHESDRNTGDVANSHLTTENSNDVNIGAKDGISLHPMNLTSNSSKGQLLNNRYKMVREPYVSTDMKISSIKNRVDSLDNYESFDDVAQEIMSYAPIVDIIFEYVLHGPYSNVTWNSLAEFTDRFGSRISGSKALEEAIDYVLNKSREIPLDNVHGEAVEVPHWERGMESAMLLKPRKTKIEILGLGGTIGTPPEGLIAPVVVVDSFHDLQRLSQDSVKGKILVFNEVYTSYGETMVYRSRAAVEASKRGAVAALVRSVTPFSINSPHTGAMSYAENVTRIPVACITIETAQMLRRMYDKGYQLELQLIMNGHNFNSSISRNVVMDITGRSKPLEQVIISGHIDSWDVGQGAMDDGGGAFISWHSLIVLRNLGLQPRRTVRGILWTAEEQGYVGASAYLEKHKAELSKINFIMESDEGTFKPRGLDVAASQKAVKIIQTILSLMKPINATQLEVSKSVGSDIELFINEGIPGASLLNDNEKYFWFHHSNADMMTVENPVDLDQCTALWAAVAYIIADLKNAIPKT